MRLFKSLFLIIPLLFGTGCDPLNVENAARILGASVDRNTAKILEAFLRGVQQAEGESKEWRELTSRIRSDFNRFPARTRIEAMALTDFAISRLKENVGEIEKITGLLNKKDYVGALGAFMALQEAVQGKNVVIGSFYPDKIDIVWRDHSTAVKKDTSLTTVALVGFNMDPSEKGKKDWSVEIRDINNKKLRTGWDHLVISSPYLAQIDVSGGKGASGIQFNPGETRLVVLYKNTQVVAIPITWGPRPEPVQPPKVTFIKLRVHTTRDDKDREIGFTYIPHLSGVGAVGTFDAPPGDVWRDRTEREFTIKMDKPFLWDDRLKHQLRVVYRSTNGDPRWIGYLSADAVLSDGRRLPLLLTGEFDMGHRGRNQTREFMFNR